MSDIYYSKYLKNKNKYLDLKKLQSGGASSTNPLAVMSRDIRQFINISDENHEKYISEFFPEELFPTQEIFAQKYNQLLEIEISTDPLANERNLFIASSLIMLALESNVTLSKLTQDLAEKEDLKNINTLVVLTEEEEFERAILEVANLHGLATIDDGSLFCMFPDVITAYRFAIKTRTDLNT
jgi:hypothetical protein